ncbi:MAG: winged helix-turn-helix transcriptional regulator [Candidatus Marinimicrobia bacterium]|nr:winged helix-turn-helix transcriptional regulator [Candidatus Neomarinimicrobiota bacterium]
MAKLHKIDTIASAAKTLRVLGHPVRMKIVEFLGTEEKYVGAIQKHIKQEQAVTSQHLKLLLVNGLVNKRRDKNFIFYSQNGKVLEGIDRLINDIS